MKIRNLENAVAGFQEFLVDFGADENTQEELAENAGIFVELFVEIDDGPDLLRQLECDTNDPPGWFNEYALRRQEVPEDLYRMLREDEAEIVPSVNLAKSLAFLFLQCWLEHRVSTL